MMVLRRASALSTKPGAWWLKPLWSLRQQWLVRKTLSEAMGRRQGSSSHCSSHFAVLREHGIDHLRESLRRWPTRRGGR